MWKRVHNNFMNDVISTLALANNSFVNAIISILVLANRSTIRTKIYQMPKLTLVGTTVTDIESGKQIDPDSKAKINNQDYIVKMIFNMQDLGDTTIIYNTTKPNKMTCTNDSLKELNEAMGVDSDYLDCYFISDFIKNDRPYFDLLFTDSNVNYLAKRIVKRFTYLQEAGRKAKQAANA